MTQAVPPDIDEDAFFAGLNLIGRTGAKQTEFGYLYDNVPVEQAAWWAKAQYQGVRVTVENRAGPVEAVEALARKLLNGGMCTHCRRTVTLATVADAKAFCRWTRIGKDWVRGCQ